ncbi:hypothetical protein FB45DRAFT_365413 [Roridomyces roridus]|uniref:Uncharacterized protein n=1 Tax=Roridomyces roridus TaxID=1738132 RepID=A0AAD7FWW7_9AGAR|nr:hypothetical protein FB45DRAFT_365413 [Roridomyces roridus]
MPVKSHSNWSYTASYEPGASRTVLTIQTVPRHVQRRGPPTVASMQVSNYTVTTPISYHPGKIQCPPAPRIPYLDLAPCISDYLLEDVRSVRQLPPTPLFPVDLEHPGLSSVHTTLLTDHIPALTTISVRDVKNRVLCEVNTGSACPGMTTADFTEFLQYLVQTRLTSYSDLSGVVHASGRPCFLGRGRALGYQEPFRGADLLLGNTLLWTLGMDHRRAWVATVDRPRGSHLWASWS